MVWTQATLVFALLQAGSWIADVESHFFFPQKNGLKRSLILAIEKFIYVVLNMEIALCHGRSDQAARIQESVNITTHVLKLVRYFQRRWQYVVTLKIHVILR